MEEKRIITASFPGVIINQEYELVNEDYLFPPKFLMVRNILTKETTFVNAVLFYFNSKLAA